MRSVDPGASGLHTAGNAVHSTTGRFVLSATNNKTYMTFYGYFT